MPWPFEPRPATWSQVHAVAEIADGCRAELVVVGSEISSRQGFAATFPPDVVSVLRDAPCPVLVAAGPP
jgi:hypothetical protein